MTTKYGREASYRKIDSCYPLKSLTPKRKCQNKLDRVAKGFALSIVHEGTNDCISELAIARLYQTAYRGIIDHFEVQKQIFQSIAPECKELEQVAPPPKCSIDSHTIHDYERALYQGYKMEKDSLYSKMNASPFWSQQHDGISKFSHEFNGVYLRGKRNSLYKVTTWPSSKGCKSN